ncbi:SOM1 protein [Colletotrichum salicis]|uniref:SOM1 protein n=1 Tax=Colletotrichum salicis TaxID=1209931 RepID=A0A135UKW8_9PEZI|nr:SOM1 protein [Colletotrichum salicis]
MGSLQKGRTSGKPKLGETRPELSIAALKQPPRNGSRTPLDPPTELHAERSPLAVERPGKHALEGTTNGALRQQQGGTVLGSVKIDRTISKDNTGGEAARLEYLLTKFGASRKPDMQRFHWPSKRRRLNETTGNPQQTETMPNERSQQSMTEQTSREQVAQAQQVLINNGINPASLSQQQFVTFSKLSPAVQVKTIATYAANLQQHQASQIPGTQAGDGSNHALQEFQMQTRLLAQQKMRRLMMSRQEQDNMSSLRHR